MPKRGSKINSSRFARIQWGVTITEHADVILPTPQNAQFAYQPQAFCFEHPYFRREALGQI
jgi:hypothetical protein